MLRLTRGALTMLLAQYRAVLSKSFLKNVTAVAVIGLVSLEDAKSETIYNLSSLTESLGDLDQAVKSPKIELENEGDKVRISYPDNYENT
ncbi:MAG: hypothetical protein ACI4NE_00140 [Succinivibrio sp.]